MVDSSWYLEIFILTGFFYLIEMFFRMIYKIRNLTSIIPKIELVKRGVLFTLLYYAIINKDIVMLMYGILLSQLIATIFFFIFSVFSLEINFAKFHKELTLIVITVLCWFLFKEIDVLNKEFVSVIIILINTLIWVFTEKRIKWELSKGLKRKF